MGVVRGLLKRLPRPEMRPLEVVSSDRLGRNLADSSLIAGIDSLGYQRCSVIVPTSDIWGRVGRLRRESN